MIKTVVLQTRSRARLGNKLNRCWRFLMAESRESSRSMGNPSEVYLSAAAAPIFIYVLLGEISDLIV